MVAMNARRLGQSFVTCPMHLQWWHTMLVERLDEVPVETTLKGSQDA
jgi:hypothetical protein